LDEVRGDTISFELGPIAAPVLERAAKPSVQPMSGGFPPATPTTSASIVTFETFGWTVGICVILGLFIVILFRARRPALSAAERAVFVDRIRAELRANGASNG
jgi:hypothetical protein